jgi:hypothetical protein
LLEENGRICIEQSGFSDFLELHDVCLDVIHEMNLDENFEGWKLSDLYYGPTQTELEEYLKKVGYVDINIKYEEIEYSRTEEEIYEPFCVAFFAAYSDWISDDIKAEIFHKKVLEKLISEKPRAVSRRLVIQARK